MPARMLGGSSIANQIMAEIAAELQDLRPILAVVLAGDRPDAKTYLKNIISAGSGHLRVDQHLLTASTSREEMLRLMEFLSGADQVDGILLLSPLPPQLDADTLVLALPPEKDVDGAHPLNLGLLAAGRPGLAPCTPLGVMQLLRRSHIAVEGAEVVVVGRSGIVGKPMAMLLTNAHATVTLCHSRTRDLPAVCRRADILVAGLGQPGVVTREFIKPGATVIDVGINKITSREDLGKFFQGNHPREQAFARHGFTLIGDVHPAVAEVAGALTPVPGGVGPLTIAMLMANTVTAARQRRGRHLRVPAERA